MKKPIKETTFDPVEKKKLRKARRRTRESVVLQFAGMEVLLGTITALKYGAMAGYRSFSFDKGFEATIGWNALNLESKGDSGWFIDTQFNLLSFIKSTDVEYRGTCLLYNFYDTIDRGVSWDGMDYQLLSYGLASGIHFNNASILDGFYVGAQFNYLYLVNALLGVKVGVVLRYMYINEQSWFEIGLNVSMDIDIRISSPPFEGKD